ncbi:hypothetical protein NQ318_013156 [Aromia moschata]|uniref:E3 ubiquitin-protein ligase n=1 Tax=Aromia moschata TaxID=1265417 RepID=A0AAV8Y087_9CUCU|nr:hypothetical protein NQ318_013156 [Aromia moschata]
MNSLEDNIKCSVCCDILQRPIMLCTGGHNTCGTCRNNLRECPTCRAPFSTIRNIELEQMIEQIQMCNIKLPCFFASKGCKFTLGLSQKESHESECRFRKFRCEGKYFAKWKCDWSGEYKDIHKHFKDFHNNHTWMEYRTEASMKVCLERDFLDIQIISFFNGQHFFYYKHKVDVNRHKVYWTFQLVGTKDQAKNFYYEFEVHQGPIRKFKVTEICENDNTNANDTFEKEKCVVMSFAAVKNFLNEEGELPIKFRIMSVKKPTGHSK